MFLMMIRAQAGTLAKAVLEGVMNSIDSFFRMRNEGVEPDGKPRIDVKLTSKMLTITDNALGFRSKEEILDVWEVFGRPHPKDDEGFSTDATYGKFRIGRGQLFSFGRNTWRSRQFIMETDIDAWGRDYQLTVDERENVTGCEVVVDLYESLSLRDIQNTVDEITRFCRYVDVDLFVNGIRVNTPPAGEKWDVVTDMVYIRKRPVTDRYGYGSGLDVYQQGVFVENIRSSEFGLEGVVVTKCEVSLNFARNQVLRRCPRCKTISKFLKLEGVTQAVKKKKLSEHESRNFVEEFSGEDGAVTYDAFMSTACLPDVFGKMWSPQAIAALARSRAKIPKVAVTPDYKVLVGFGPRGDQTATRVMQHRLALVLDEALLTQLRADRFEDPVEAQKYALSVITGADRASRSYGDIHLRLRWVDYTTLLAEDGDDHTRLSPDEYSDREREFLRHASGVLRALDAHDNGWSDMENRKLCIGLSNVSDAWTDGSTYICVSRDWVSGLSLGMERDWHKIGLLLARMFSHKTTSLDREAEEAVDYLRNFHALSAEIPRVARYAFTVYRTSVLRMTGKLPKAMREQLNAEAETYVADALLFDAAGNDPEGVSEEETQTSAVGLN